MKYAKWQKHCKEIQNLKDGESANGEEITSFSKSLRVVVMENKTLRVGTHVC